MPIGPGSPGSPASPVLPLFLFNRKINKMYINYT